MLLRASHTYLGHKHGTNLYHYTLAQPHWTYNKSTDLITFFFFAVGYVLHFVMFEQKYYIIVVKKAISCCKKDILRHIFQNY
jgi:hypothetical protein